MFRHFILLITLLFVTYGPLARPAHALDQFIEFGGQMDGELPFLGLPKYSDMQHRWWYRTPLSTGKPVVTDKARLRAGILETSFGCSENLIFGIFYCPLKVHGSEVMRLEVEADIFIDRIDGQPMSVFRSVVAKTSVIVCYPEVITSGVPLTRRHYGRKCSINGVIYQIRLDVTYLGGTTT